MALGLGWPVSARRHQAVIQSLQTGFTVSVLVSHVLISSKGIYVV